jgi:hypothetical protein
MNLSSVLRLLRSPHVPLKLTSVACLKAAVALLIVSVPALVYAQDEKPAVPQTAPVLRVQVMQPAKTLSDRSGAPRVQPKLRAAVSRPRANTGGSGLVYTCASNIATSTCNYLNTTVAGYYNSTFTNANANIYIQYGNVGLGQSSQYDNYVPYSQYVSALTNNTNQSANQTTAISSLNSNDASVYGNNNVEVTSALGTALGFSGMTGIKANSDSCTVGDAGCYNVIVTVIDATDAANNGFSLYYDDQGGTEPSTAYDFYGVVQHETDEALGTSSCDSTQSTPLSDGCSDGGSGTPSAVDLFRYSASGNLAIAASPSTTPGQYFSFDGGATNPVTGRDGSARVYNTLDNGDDYADYISSSPDCGTGEAVQDAEGCPGEDSGLSILNDGQSEITILNVVGYDIPPASAAGSLSPNSLTFTGVNVGSTSAYQRVFLTNTGSSTLTGVTFTVAGTDSSSFFLPANRTGCGSTLAAGAACTFQVAFKPTTAGALSGSIEITDNGSNSPQVLALSGTGITPTTASVNPTSMSFGSVNVGSTSAYTMATLTNTGAGTLYGISFTINGASASSFSIPSNHLVCASTLAAGASCSFDVAFTPTTTGSLSASVQISNSGTSSPQTIALTGTGTSAIVTLTPSSLTFYSTTVGSTAAYKMVTLQNTGTGTLSISSFSVTGTNATSFALPSNHQTCKLTLAAGSSCTFDVSFTPTATGALTASVQIATNASVSLTGTGK